MLSLEYIAGFFDGEGSIGLYPDGRGRQHLRTQLTQNCGDLSERLLTELKDRWGGNLTIQKTRTGTKFNWQLNSATAAAFLTEIQPYLFLKSEQATIALGWWAIRLANPATRDAKGHFRTVRDPIDDGASQLLRQLKKMPIGAVMAAQDSLVEIVHRLRQVLNVKG